ncbi:hypothetical protein GLOIN_2v1763658 [Rhizophagus irregularis DAOM 181602=DAOM 197198]|uniref:Protein kinase domain-containing protein n=1 Tax=Rhizophagus irregularis (strain DAOM 181602 / DAOM 197198 / MUCL 43194) TaxID=747089 RepID=A0A2P4QTU8_RHIID|nr:hypothetical protein GLOIN_2v1763658 [Rhizophagus irregularis DAOM 181602=DAOM 197198]POG81042.1 hypothetical protein GLOIN_2v1763658 [Rhizophagus irregularis DAOM 181602=DAOM 197198]|eukprot:XP_025187908.1 hypothetical protein GLOIN_2v1763658 [Rhizophagus irregularis DAOM 181602=DAOM 197198]
MTVSEWMRPRIAMQKIKNVSNENTNTKEIDEYHRNCKQQRTAAAWCKTYDIAILKENLRNWTSGNPSAFSSIYSAIWMEGPRWNLDEEAERYCGYVVVGLITIHKLGLVHGHLHGVSSQQTYGVIPFVAPEILDGNSTPTKESDMALTNSISTLIASETGISEIYDNPDPSDLSKQFDAVKKFRF